MLQILAHKLDRTSKPLGVGMGSACPLCLLAMPASLGTPCLPLVGLPINLLLPSPGQLLQPLLLEALMEVNGLYPAGLGHVLLQPWLSASPSGSWVLPGLQPATVSKATCLLLNPSPYSAPVQQAASSPGDS